MLTADEKDGHTHNGCEGQAHKRCRCECATLRIKELDDKANGSVVFLVVNAIIPIFQTPPRCDISGAFVVHLVCGERCTLELEVCTRCIEFLFNSNVCTYVGPIQTGFLRGFQKFYGGRRGIVIPVKKMPQEQKTQES
jgi:hypothetical protein